MGEPAWIRCWRREKEWRPSGSRTTISPSSRAWSEPIASPSSRSSGNEAVMSLPFRLTARGRPPSTQTRTRMPSHLNSKAHSPVVGGEGARCRPASAPDGSGSGSNPSGGGSIRWIIQILPLGREEDVAALEPRSPCSTTMISRSRPLLALVGAPVPDRDLAGPVLPGGDGAAERPVLQRMVLDVHRQMVLVGGQGQALGEGPRSEDTVVLEAEVPVQARGVVLLDDEPRACDRGSGRRMATAGVRRNGLWGDPLPALPPVVGERFPGHEEARPGGRAVAGARWHVGGRVVVVVDLVGVTFMDSTALGVLVGARGSTRAAGRTRGS